jgi:hypothetical protein
MNNSGLADEFYASVPMFRDFTRVLDPALYKPLPDDWLIGVADVVESTKAIRENHYKAVNMAGAAVIVAVTNALEGRDFPFVFGGDGASFAVPASAAEQTREALAATATWVKNDLNLMLRVSLMPVSTIRQSDADVRVARFAPSANIVTATFSGGGIAWAEAAMKEGQFAVVPSPPNVRPDLTGLSCRYEEIPAARGLILALVVVPAPGAKPEPFRAVVDDIVRMAEHSPNASRPVPGQGPNLKWPPTGYEFEARAKRGAHEALALRRAKVLVWTFVYFLIMRFGIRVRGFIPQKYTEEVVENSDFRKFDDALRMILDCSPELSSAIEQRLNAAADQGVVRYGLHRQSAAMMTCFTPSPTSANHVHFIDGALGGYAAAARGLKASAG